MRATIPLPRLAGLHDHTLTLLLGEGGMGKVYLATHKPTGEQVVVKTMHPHLLDDPKSRQRFQQEADLMRRFSHPNAVAFRSASPQGVDPPFIIMEFVNGITVSELLEKHDRLSPLRVGKLLAPLCLFLQTAHDNGLLHRDLTPANLMILHADTPRETIKVMDFGLARGIGFYIPTGQLDSQSSAIDGGTPDFICPEQIEGRQVDHRGDIYSVGVLLYYLLTGHVPYEHLKEPRQILLANVHTPPPRFSQFHVTGIPSIIEKLVLSCLSKSPADRPDSARTLIETYELALGTKLLDDKAFEASSQSAISSLRERHRFDPRCVIDQFEALMLEHTASIKLRGFVDGVGGEVIESDAGVIKVRLPRVVQVEQKKSGLWSLFGPKVKQEIDWIPIELHMSKKQSGTRSLVDITLVRPHPTSHAGQKQFCEEVCRELRAYLMVGR
ncbi:MAG TPA: serine/threonine-protein kinase [Gemmataceae bacterium]|nr:serine/threonine-protein kinase [Gemmataceae bacterium]